MNIKKSTKKSSSWTEHPVVHFVCGLRKNVILVLVVFIILIAGTNLASIYYGMQMYKLKKADSFAVFFENAIKTKFNIIPNYLRGRFAANPERIMIDVKHRHLQRIAYKRELAMNNGILLTSSEDFVPAQIRYKDRTIDVKIRLKGDWTDHLLGEKWSFRIKVKGDNTIFGMKQFSIHHPKTRTFIYEWIYHEALRREDIISLRYDFIEVSLNGKDLGIYALEEHFEKRLIENNQYREGPIIKFDENLLWADRAMHHRKGMLSPTGIAQETASTIDVFKANTILSSPTLYGQFITAHSLLDRFRNGELPFQKAFDVKKMATFFAVSDVLGAEHSVMWQNLRFYYNPVTALLEPVGFDANAGRKIYHVTGSNRALHKPIYKFKDLAFSNVVFYEAYTSELERLSSPTYLDKLFSQIDTELEENLNKLYREFPYFHFSKRVFYENQESIQYALNPVNAIHAYHRKSVDDRIEFELGNIHALPIEVLDISREGLVTFQPNDRTILEPKQSYQPLKYEKVTFSIPAGFVWSDTMRAYLKLNYKILGTHKIRQAAVFAWPREIDEPIENHFMRQEPNADQFDFITMDQDARKIHFKPGQWNLDQDLIIPSGYRVYCGGGTKIRLSNSASILSYSPLEFKGTEELPIVIQSEDSTGQGLLVLNAQQFSVLEYVTFHNLSNPSKGNWGLTGAVTFYESPVHFSHCQFENNRSEDGLNIIRTEFTIDHSLFKETFSDAFDGDFVKGTISNSVFLACGNDAVDLSGSEVEVRSLLIDRAGDKGLSAGENSQMVVKDVEILNSEIAVASKDRSEMHIDTIDISDCQIGFTLYQKKPEFDAAVIEVVHLTKNNVKVPYLVEERSKLVIDGSVIATNGQNVKDILYGVEYGKSSKRATN